MDYATTTAFSGKASAMGWQAEQPDHWLARPDPWEVARPNEGVEVKLSASFEIRNGALSVVQARPSHRGNLHAGTLLSQSPISCQKQIHYAG